MKSSYLVESTCNYYYMSVSFNGWIQNELNGLKEVDRPSQQNEISFLEKNFNFRKKLLKNLWKKNLDLSAFEEILTD